MENRSTNGLLLVDKPAGLTSHDVVNVARRALGIRRVGHAGTLDPFATGLLILLAGRATRLAPYLDDEPKMYEATVRLGAETDTDDGTGVVIRTGALPGRPDVEAAMAALAGAITQVPPAFSAKQVNGERAYRAARRGAAVPLAPVTVQVEPWELRDWRTDELDVTITCGGGTYIRALARDLGRLTQSAAHLSALRRVRCGAFSVTDAHALKAVRAGAAPLLPALAAVLSLPARVLTASEAARVRHGQGVTASEAGPRAALVDAAGELVALAERNGDQWRPRVVMCDG